MSKIEKHIDKIQEWSVSGKSNYWIANQLGTSEATVRRAKKRHNMPSERPDDIAVFTGAKSVEWGYGQAQLVKPATFEDYEVSVVLSDLHFPYQENKVVWSSLRFIKALQPHRVVLNGDINDFFQLSRFNTGYDRLDTLQDEIDQANDFRKTLRDIVPNAVIDETEGNHDNRIRSFVAHNAKALHSLRGLQPEKLFLYDDLDINWHPGCGFLLRDDFLVKHGTALSSIPGGTARAELNLNMISGVSGHVHRSEQAQRHSYREISWNVSGTMSRLDPDYIIGKPAWNQSILVVENSNKSGLHSVTNVPMFDGKLSFGGKFY